MSIVATSCLAPVVHARVCVWCMVAVRMGEGLWLPVAHPRPISGVLGSGEHKRRLWPMPFPVRTIVASPSIPCALCESRLWLCVQAPAPNAWEGNTATVFGSDCQWMTSVAVCFVLSNISFRSSSRWVFHSLLKVLPTPHTYFCVLSLPSPVPFVEAVAVPLLVSAVPSLYRAVAVCC